MSTTSDYSIDSSSDSSYAAHPSKYKQIPDYLSYTCEILYLHGGHIQQEQRWDLGTNSPLKGFTTTLVGEKQFSVMYFKM